MILALLVSIVLMQQGPANAGAAAVVSGRVVDAATGRPIPGAIISSAGSAVAAPGASSPVRVMTSAGGEFVLRGVGAGTLVLTAARGGYVAATPGQRRPGGSAQPLHIREGERRSGVEIRMWKHAAIAGTIVDETGDPAVGTRVQALRRTFVTGRARFVESGTAVTDDRGIYRIAGLTPADYVVAVPFTQTSVPAEIMDVFFGGTPASDATRMQLGREMNAIGSAIVPTGSEYALRDGAQIFSLPLGSATPSVSDRRGTIIYPTVYFPAAAGLRQASIVTLRAGEERSGIDLQVRPIAGVRVSGILLGPDGPVTAAGIRLLPARDGDAAEPIEVATTMTDWTGAFTFAAVPPGSYELRVLRLPQPPPDADGTPRISTTPAGTTTIASTPAPPSSVKPPVPADATLVAQMPLAVGTDGIADLIVSLAPAPRLAGRVEFVGTTDKPGADAIRGMRITLDPIDGAPLFEPSLALEAGHADGTGEFRTYGLPPGRYVLHVAPVAAGWYLESAMADGRDIADEPIELQSKDVTGVVLTFTDRPSAITGTITGSNGADASAVAIVFPADETLWTSATRRLRTARAAADGTFAIQALPAGDYYVAAVQEDLVGEWQDPALLKSLAPIARTVRLVDGERKAIDLRAVSLR